MAGFWICGIFWRRPTWQHYSTSARNIYICSVFNAARRWSAWDVRLSCGEDGSAQIRGCLDGRKRSQHCNAFHSRVRFRVSHRQNPSVHQVIL